ncbi:hypothetical protein NDU88_003557 [Pleurodeles waltl]|uniref:Uncharacterized protein n=1 Tax=Pleurodeles waltl TaxID=8319 RepID=A0AAV7SDT6_PLEWA|nr:hypothetical protein NDU88_003557 [Pleurodeles waltl]
MEEGARSQEEDVREDAARVGEEPETHTTERGFTYNIRGDVDPADKWSAQRERKTGPKKDEEGDAFKHIRKDGNQEC